MEEIKRIVAREAAWCSGQPLYSIESDFALLSVQNLSDIKFAENDSVLVDYSKLRSVVLTFNNMETKRQNSKITDEEIVNTLNIINKINQSALGVLGVAYSFGVVDLEIDDRLFLNELLKIKITDGSCSRANDGGILCQKSRFDFALQLERIISCQIKKSSQQENNSRPALSVMTLFSLPSLELIPLIPGE